LILFSHASVYCTDHTPPPARRYFFAVTNYYLYGESLIYYFKHILTLQASFLPTAYTFAQHHRLISFGLYTIGKFSRGVFCVW
jgi:hypothetical protein